MDESTSTALYTGAFVMVFISSLTIAIFLFNGILDFSELAYNHNINIADNQTLVNVPVGTERLVSPEEVASYYYNYVDYDLYATSNAANSNFILKIYTEPTEASSSLLEKSDTMTYKDLMDEIGINKTYILTYESVDSAGKSIIKIKPATQEQIDSTF